MHEAHLDTVRHRATANPILTLPSPPLALTPARNGRVPAERSVELGEEVQESRHAGLFLLLASTLYGGVELRGYVVHLWAVLSGSVERADLTEKWGRRITEDRTQRSRRQDPPPHPTS